MKKVDSPRLWCRPRPASRYLGIAYSTTIRLVKKGEIPAKVYFAGGKKRYLIEIAWIIARGGRIS